MSKHYDSLIQRGVNYFLATYSGFHSIPSEEVSEAEQQNAYNFIRQIYQSLFDTPSLLGMKDFPDDCFEDWTYHKENPELVTRIRKYIVKTEEVITYLYHIVIDGRAEGDSIIIPITSIRKSPSILKLYANLQLTCEKTDLEYIFSFPQATARGLKLLAKISREHDRQAVYQNAEHLLFSRGCFAAEKGFMKEVFTNNSEDKAAVTRLLEYLEEKAYCRIENREHKNTFAQVSLDYIKFYDKQYDKIPAGWGERTHGGIEVNYEETRKNPLLVTLRVPYFASLLQSADLMNEKVKSFVTTVSKKCDNCGYCTQTDKTGKRAKSFILVDNKPICTLFCGYQFRWRRLDEGLVDQMIEMLEFIDARISKS